MSIYGYLLAELQEYLFPFYCIGCCLEGSLLCSTCNDSIVAIPKVIDDLSLRVLSLAPYEEGGLISKIIEIHKYQYVEEALSIFEKIIEKEVSNNIQFFSDVDSICSIPLHKKRYAMRGFNQSDYIARIVSTYTEIPISDDLIRVRSTQQQARLSREERLVNTKGAFKVKGTVKGKHILLIDDVYTTGSTLHSACQTLQKAGVMTAKGFVLARG